MKTGKHYFGLLTEDEQQNFRQACEEQHVDFNYHMNDTFKSFEQFIYQSFIWVLTDENEGHEYWEAIANSNRDENSN